MPSIMPRQLSEQEKLDADIIESYITPALTKYKRRAGVPSPFSRPIVFDQKNKVCDICEMIKPIEEFEEDSSICNECIDEVNALVN